MSPQKQEKLFQASYAKVLINIALGDLNTARALSSAQNYRIENAFYMAQQCIEKSLRAVLVSQKIPVPLINDVAALLSKLPQICEPPYGYELNELSEYAGIRRYEEGHWEPSIEDLNEVIEKASHMFNWASEIISKANL